MVNNELLTVDEVAALLRTTPNTIYRWLRAGKIQGVKIGKEWRLHRDALLSKLSEPHQENSKSEIFDKINHRQDHVLVIADNPEDLYDIEAEYFKAGLKKGFRLFKGCWWQHPDDVRIELSNRGIFIDSLEKNDRLTIVDLSSRFKKGGVDGPVEAWLEESEKSVELGYPLMWGTGSPHLKSCGEDVSALISFEELLHRELRQRPVVGICPYILHGNCENIAGPIIDLLRHHNSLIMYSRGRAAYLKA